MYVCKRCNYETNLKSNILSHLKTKKECPIKNEDIDRNTLILELISSSRKRIEREKYCCSGCRKDFI
jgi:hypothetical protein